MSDFIVADVARPRKSQGIRTLASSATPLIDRSLFRFILMPNHWHLVLRPIEDGQMGRLLRWVTATDTLRYRGHYHNRSQGHLYQGRFKSFPIADDEHFYVVCRYVERNAMRAGLVNSAKDWPS